MADLWLPLALDDFVHANISQVYVSKPPILTARMGLRFFVSCRASS
ncbi:MAG: hypothetical protein HA492_04925 [Candidatus Verstraetearchaeota archaeon]|nr:hypothetical protein [Candidatus Verstraetearchaeota archaeon]